MRDGVASRTAQRVAAHRLGFERLATAYGDPAADERLARNVAGDDLPSDSGQLNRYLRARTAFFDRTVVNAISRGVTQVVVVGAGYDGRAWRYAKAGVRWWEVDHPDTQADKLARLRALQIDAGETTFVPFDLEQKGLATALTEAGFQPDGAALLVAEGLLLYLTAEGVRTLLGELRSLAAPGTRLAVSLPRPGPGDTASTDGGWRQSAAQAGEPVRTDTPPEEMAAWVAQARWGTVEISDRARNAGFAVLAPQWSPSHPEGPATIGRIGAYLEQQLYRAGGDGLGRHLETTYRKSLSECRELDVGVFAVDWRHGPRWIARVFPAARPLAAASADAELLSWLGQSGMSAERTAAEPAVSLHEGQAVLITERVAGRPLDASADSFRHLGQLLGRLHRLPAGCPAAHRPGGAWHHLVSDGSPTDEIPALTRLWEAASARAEADRTGYEMLGAELAALDACGDLPHAVVHPDPVPRNAIRRSDGKVILIDWSGAGWGPRVAALGCLLWAAGLSGPACAEAAARGYAEEVTLSAAEIERLPVAARLRPLTLAVWAFATGRSRLDEALRSWQEQRIAVGNGTRAAQEVLIGDGAR